MSRFFEAIRNTGGAIAKIALAEQPPAAQPVSDAGSAQVAAAIERVIGEGAAELPRGAAAGLVETRRDQEAASAVTAAAAVAVRAQETVPPAASVKPRQALLETVRRCDICVPAGSPVFPFDGSDDLVAERYRILRTNIANHPKKPRMFCVSSGTVGDGKTVTATNIAGALALKQDAKVLLIDGDMRRPAVARLLGIAAQPGITNVLAGTLSWHEAAVRVNEVPNLVCLLGGESTAAPSELLDGRRWRELCEEMRRLFDFVVIDAAPIGAVADYDLIEPVTDGVIIVARPDHSSRKALNSALDAAAGRGKLLGVVMNCAEPWFLWKSGGDHYAYSRAGA